MSCLPGMPCFGNHPNNPSPITCGVDPCFTYKTTTDLAHYVGPNLPCIDVNTCETLTSIIQKIDYALCGENLVQTFIDTLLTNTTLYNLFCSQVIQNCVTCDYMKDCIDCEYINDCIPPCPPCPTTSTTSTSTTAIPYYCYMATAASTATYSLQWTDPIDGLVVITLNNQTVKFCAQQNSVYYNWVSGTGNFSLIGGVSPCTASPDCWEEFRMQAEDVSLLKIDRIAFSFGNDSPILVEWGDGTETFLSTSPSIDVTHTYDPLVYPSGYTGDVVIKCADLTNITSLWLEDVFGLNVPPIGKSLTITGPEITKLDGLTDLRTRWATLNCTTSELPRGITSILRCILGNISGDVANLPPNIVSISLSDFGLGGVIYQNSNTISGNVSAFKSTLRSISILGNNTLTGDINSINSSVRNLCTTFNIDGDNTITGDITSTFNANTVLVSFNVDGKNTIFGNLDGNGIVPAFPSTVMLTFLLSGYSYPSGTTLGAFGHMSILKTLSMEFDENTLPWPTNVGTSLTGDVADLPSSINFCLIAGANTVSGNVLDIPSGVYAGQTSYINIRGVATGSNPGGGNYITGDVADIPTNCRFFTVTSGSASMYGDVANIPDAISAPSLTTVRIGTTSLLLTGNLWDVPSQLKVLELVGGNVRTYVPSGPYPTLVPTKAWAANMNRLWVVPQGLPYFSKNDMSQLLIDLDNTTWSTSSSFITKEIYILAVDPMDPYDPIAAPAYTSLTTTKGVIITFV